MRFVVDEDEDGRRADVVVADRAGVTRTLAQRALRGGDVTVGGEVVRPGRRLAAGELVAGAVPAPTFAPPEPEDIPVVVRYEDDRVLVVSKPAGLVTHPARGHDTGTLVNALLGRGGALAGLGTTRPGIVHRLDKDTSGLLLVAKDDAAHAHLVAALRARQVERRYLALIRGRPAAPSGTVDAPVGRHPRHRKLMAVVPEGRPAVTHYRTVAASDEVTLVDVSLETGRTHQIRVHLSHLGHPVVGDRAYGGRGEPATRLGLDRPFLHSWRLAFPHPDGGRRVDVADPLPDELGAALAAAGLRPPRT
jgi:23S rRNA pseudouridine1911/1915/1917 synthase